MKLLFTTVLVFIFGLVAMAQSKDEKTIAELVEQLRTAMLGGDRAKLESLVAEKLSYGHSGGHIDDKKEFVEKLASGSSDFVTIDLSEQTVSVSDNVAIVRHILNAKTNDGGKPGEAHLRVLLIWQKQKAGWKLLARQAVKIV